MGDSIVRVRFADMDGRVQRPTSPQSSFGQRHRTTQDAFPRQSQWDYKPSVADQTGHQREHLLRCSNRFICVAYLYTRKTAAVVRLGT